MVDSVAPAVNQDDRRPRQRPGRGPTGAARPRLRFIERHEHLRRRPRPARRSRPLASVKHRGRTMCPSENVGPRLITDPQRIARSRDGDRQRERLAFALEQGVGCNLAVVPMRTSATSPPSSARTRRIASSAASSYWPGFSDSNFSIRTRPSPARATTSVKVPPRSIAKLHD